MHVGERSRLHSFIRFTLFPEATPAEVCFTLLEQPSLRWLSVCLSPLPAWSRREPARATEGSWSLLGAPVGSCRFRSCWSCSSLRSSVRGEGWGERELGLIR